MYCISSIKHDAYFNRLAVLDNKHIYLIVASNSTWAIRGDLLPPSKNLFLINGHIKIACNQNCKMNAYKTLCHYTYH